MTKRMGKVMDFIAEIEWELAFQASNHEGSRMEYFFLAKHTLRIALKGIIWIADLPDNEYKVVEQLMSAKVDDLHNWFYKRIQ